MNILDQFNDWTKKYRWLATLKKNTELTFHINHLPPILDELAREAHKKGIDVTSVLRLQHGFASIRMNLRDLENMLDEVLLVVGLLKLEPIKPSIDDAKTKEVDAFMTHCRLTRGTHQDKAKTWIALHPDEKRTIEQLKRKSERWGNKNPA